MGFNPTLVRLRHKVRQGSLGVSSKFQSHAGSIEAMMNPDGSIWVIPVSIPRWFD